MEVNPPPFTLESISLLSVNFERSEATISSDAVENDLRIDLSRTSEAPFLHVTLQVDLKQKRGNEILLAVTASTIGKFRIAQSVDEILVDNFADIGAPAIIFPFVRELIASLTARAGIPTVLVQPLNFVDMAQRRQRNQLLEE